MYVMDSRRRSLLDGAQQLGCDSLVACNPENIFYMTGFWGEGMAVLDADHTTIVAPALEAGRAESESCDCQVVSAERGANMHPAVARLLANMHPCTDCADHATVLRLQKLIGNIQINSHPFLDSRTIKDPDEIRTLQEASGLIDELFGVCAKEMVVGMSEHQLQAILMSHAARCRLFDTGYPSTLNPLIVAGGPNGALPHAQVSDRRFQKGDLVVVDITLRYEGYVSDATRTFGIQKVDPTRTRIYEVVRQAQELGLRAATDGASCRVVDAACRDHIESQGYGSYFIHSTGHGVGLEVHEEPAISASSETILRDNMTITVEPGIYLPGQAGVRIEDSMVVGGQSMHQYTKDLIITG